MDLSGLAEVAAVLISIAALIYQIGKFTQRVEDVLATMPPLEKRVSNLEQHNMQKVYKSHHL